MKSANIYTAKTQLSQLLAEVEQGATITLCRRNEPIAELRPMVKPRRAPRPIGLGKGSFKLSKLFFEPLPADLEALFSGEER